MKKKGYTVQIVLFLLTVISTLVAGTLQKGINIISEPQRIVEGVPFSLSLMAILLTHELSHYFASKLNHTEATLPYFIPAPSIFGTFGAFIKMKSPITTRKALIEIGASGPIGGFLVALVVTIYGLSLSRVVDLSSEQVGLVLGDSIIFSILSRIIVGVPPEGKDVLLHPVAFAGWIGFFVTAMNLLPIGQLDGGHISFALFGHRRHRRISFFLATTLALVGISRLYLYSDIFSSGIFNTLRNYLWEGWAVWAFLLFMLGIEHPPVMFWEEPLPRSRMIMGYIALAIFILTFVPVPIKVVQ
ncbi:MAG TPA: site-2 protease family protein [Nitrospirae bacterium]|nr:site-2 protease family protein [Nitrospirota bacterium]